MSRSKNRFSVFVATPHCCWEEDELNLKDPDTLLLLWFVELQAGIHVVLEEANLHEIEVIFIRTNIRKLNTALNKDLYTHAPQCERVASDIHDYLNLMRALVCHPPKSEVFSWRSMNKLRPGALNLCWDFTGRH